MEREDWDKEQRRADVAVAARLLDGDVEAGNWRDKLVAHYGDDLAEMNVSEPDRCVLYAVYGSWSGQIERFWPENRGGFSCHAWEDDDMRELWLEQVRRSGQ